MGQRRFSHPVLVTEFYNPTVRHIQSFTTEEREAMMGGKKKILNYLGRTPPAPAITSSSWHWVELSKVETEGVCVSQKLYRQKDFSALLTPIFWVCFSYKEQTHSLFRNYRRYFVFFFLEMVT